MSLLLAVVFFAVAGAALSLLNPINTQHVTVTQPTPGQVTLPPTATPPVRASASPSP